MAGVGSSICILKNILLSWIADEVLLREQHSPLNRIMLWIPIIIIPVGNIIEYTRLGELLKPERAILE
jgi:hypothetical protein